VRNYRLRFKRLKEKLFYPEITEITLQFEKKFETFRDDLVEKMNLVMMKFESRSVEI
jgi:hypothetical protein